MSTEFWVPHTLRGGRGGEPFGLPVELVPLVDRVPLDVLREAAHRAGQVGVGGDEVLVAAGVIGREAYTRRLAAWLGLAFATLDEPRGAPGLPAPPLHAIAAGFMAIGLTRRGPQFVAAPGGRQIRDLVRLVRQDPGTARTLCLTTPARLEAAVQRRAGPRLAEAAAFDLVRRAPDLSAAYRCKRQRLPALVVAGALALAAAAAPGPAAALVHVVLALCFLSWTALRTLALLHPDPGADRPAVASARGLPVYSVVVALYREARVVPALIAALEALDYPPEKLDILLMIEADDAETRRALDAAGLPPSMRVIASPKPGPRTKPKALNAALPFARGRFLVVYDAEDRPEPDQLRRALAAFAAGGPRLACVQARLAIDNARDGWLTRMFAADYAGQFDVLLPLLVAHGLPVPLGGTSNHFRLDVLRRVGGWDPFNVTEDADLGIRLARFGWRTALIASTTWEEAPRRLPAWLRQRTRWFKGWMQTWLVHMRHPRRLLGELGLMGFLSVQLIVGGTILSALVHPVFVALLAVQAVGGAPGGGMTAVLAGLSVATLISGYIGSAALGLVGLARRRLLPIGWVFLLQPVYWLMLSAAAWRALWQLIVNPFHWEKTEHGFARTSLRGAAGSGVKDSAAARPPRRRAAA